MSLVETGASAGLFSLWTGFPFWGCWGISLAVRLAGELIAIAVGRSTVRTMSERTAREP